MSKYTKTAVEFVKNHQGCSKWDLARHLTWHPLRSPSKQYYLVNTQIAHGTIVAVKMGNRYALFTA